MQPYATPKQPRPSEAARVECVCLHCGGHFLIYPSHARAGRGRYCSLKCHGLARTAAARLRPQPRSAVERVCRRCGLAFLVAPSRIAQGGGQYCSKHCYHPTVPSGPRACEMCGKPITGRGRRFCSHPCLRASYADGPARFWKRVDRSQPDGCWPWMGARRRKGAGHGHFMLNGETITAHRYALILATGGDRAGLHALHRCNFPPCCNPAHLYWGTPADNSADWVAAGGPPNRKLSAERVRQMRAERAAGWSLQRLAARYGIDHSTVSAIVRGETWKWA